MLGSSSHEKFSALYAVISTVGCRWPVLFVHGCRLFFSQLVLFACLTSLVFYANHGGNKEKADGRGKFWQW